MKLNQTYVANDLGVLAKLSIWKHILDGNDADLVEAYYYARRAARAGLVALETGGGK